MRRLDPKIEGLPQERTSLRNQVSQSRRSPGYGTSFIQASKATQAKPELLPAQKNEVAHEQEHQRNSTQAVAHQKGVIQKDEPASASSNHFQLNPPSLMQPQDPYAKYKLGDYRLRLDPEFDPQFQAMVTQRLYQSLDPY